MQIVPDTIKSALSVRPQSEIIVLLVRIDDNYSISIAGSVPNYFWMIWQLHLQLLAGQKIDRIWPGQIYADSIAISICNHYRSSKTSFPKVQVAITTSIVQPLRSRRLVIQVTECPSLMSVYDPDLFYLHRKWPHNLRRTMGYPYSRSAVPWRDLSLLCYLNKCVI